MTWTLFIKRAALQMLLLMAWIFLAIIAAHIAGVSTDKMNGILALAMLASQAAERFFPAPPEAP